MSSRVSSAYICIMLDIRNIIRKPNKKLHSAEHLLAEDLSRAMLEPKKFARYLGVAKLYHESDLRALAKRVLVKKDLAAPNRGKYFFGAIKGLEKKIIWKKEKNSENNNRRKK